MHKLLALLAAAIASTVLAYAQTNAWNNGYSLEAEVLNARFVALGNITSIATADNNWLKVTVRVSQVLKGVAGPEITFQFSDYPPRAAEWKRKSSPLLIIKSWDKYRSVEATDLSDPELTVPTAEFGFLHNSSSIINAISLTVQRFPRVNEIRVMRIMVPGPQNSSSAWERTYGSRDYTSIVVPVLRPLEQMGRAQIRSKSLAMREQGARILGEFKSEESIDLLKPLLNDPEPFIEIAAEYNHGTEIRTYPVRAAAQEILRTWGEETPAITTREEVSRLDSIETIWWLDTPDEATIEKLPRAKKIQGLYFGISLLTNKQLDMIGQISTLKFLQLLGESVRDETLAHLSKLTNLESLDIGISKVTDEGLKSLAALTNLKTLSLIGSRVTDNGLRILAGFPNLKRIVIDATQVTDQGVAAVRKLRPDLAIDLVR